MSTTTDSNTSYSINSQVIYNWAGQTDPVKIGEGDSAKHVVGHDDFVRAMSTSEEAFGQLIQQGNNDKIRQAVLINDGNLASLDPGTATTSDLSVQLNSVITILTNLILQGKQ